MAVIKTSLEFVNYIAHPYLPARNLCIEIEKKSGVNRQKSDEKRVAALKAECQRQGITYERYLELREEAAVQWYRRPKDNRIYIPRHQIAGAFVQVIGTAPKSLRGIFTKDNFRALVQISDFVTDRAEPTGVFARFVKLETSNQRSWQENEYIGRYLDNGKPFEAEGVLSLADPKQNQTAKALLAAVVENIGVGASRKMGFGRGRILAFKG